MAALWQGAPEQGGVGLSISKRFGPTEINAIYTQDLYSKNAAEGNRLWLNVSFPLGGPDSSVERSERVGSSDET